MDITTKDLRLNLASILSQVSAGQSVNISYGRGKNKQVFQLTKQTDSDQIHQEKIEKIFEKMKNRKLSDKEKKLQKLSQEDFQKLIKNMYEF